MRKYIFYVVVLENELFQTFKYICGTDTRLFLRIGFQFSGGHAVNFLVTRYVNYFSVCFIIFKRCCDVASIFLLCCNWLLHSGCKL